ncbi:MAG: N-acetyl-gamma-glutamyl-phosphate reductase [Calditrichaeota bacterium]|nr:N-acetyl-gamma-glutamyl-phosphate reductase [Calditrichota bacterium]
MIRAGIVGGAGYTGGELLRILLNHPWCDVRFVYSRSQQGRQVTEVHSDLIGETDLRFEGEIHQDADILFLCMGHGESRKFLSENKIDPKIKIIDLSQDFRIKSPDQYPFVYGLPEAFKDEIRKAGYVANPGCFATAVQLALLPLAKEGLLKDEAHVSAITGSTGAGQSLKTTSHYSWRNNNVSVYKPFTHQHLAEIRKTLQYFDPAWQGEMAFIPLRGSFTRGILAAVYTKVSEPLENIREMYRSYYDEHPFVFIVNDSPDVKQVVNTNKALLYLAKHDDRLLIVSVIDNLIKGASGQAVQNMNLLFGFDETIGLRLKPSAF